MDSTERRRRLLKELSAITTEPATKAARKAVDALTPECPTCAARRAKRAALARAYRERKAKGNEP